jgi:hypothetical protein
MFIVIQFRQLVAPLCLKQLPLCVTNNGAKFSTAVQCRSTLVRYTCVAGSAATGTRVSGVLCTEHGIVSCWNARPVCGVYRCTEQPTVTVNLRKAHKLVSERRLHVSSGDGSFQIRFWRVLSGSQSVRLPAWHIPCQDVAWATAGYVPCLFQFVIG